MSPVVFFHYENVLICEKIDFSTTNLKQRLSFLVLCGALPLGFVQQNVYANPPPKAHAQKPTQAAGMRECDRQTVKKLSTPQNNNLNTLVISTQICIL
jgi:hypothetical protein